VHAFGKKLSAAPRIVRDVVTSPAQPLRAPVRGTMEARFGHDFGTVRVHADARAADAASAVGARAFTVNRHVVFGAGEYAPGTESGRALLSHELAHVAEGRDPAFQDVILRAPITPHADNPDGDKKRLKRLYNAAKATAVGKAFLSAAKEKPELEWGDARGQHAQTALAQSPFEPSVIVLNASEATAFSDCWWEQVIVFEFGNLANANAIDRIMKDAEKGNQSKDELLDGIEKIEYKSRGLVIDAYDGGQFGADCAPAFPGGQVSYEKFFAEMVKSGHTADYEQFWDQKCKAAYAKKHPK
jgi:hypothetical protein